MKKRDSAKSEIYIINCIVAILWRRKEKKKQFIKTFRFNDVVIKRKILSTKIFCNNCMHCVSVWIGWVRIPLNWNYVEFWARHIVERMCSQNIREESLLTKEKKYRFFFHGPIKFALLQLKLCDKRANICPIFTW